MSQYHTVLNQLADLLDDAQQDAPLAADCITAGSIQNIGIYRNNIQLNRINALRIAYPTVAALLGEEFFDGMSLIYVQITPGRHANLHTEGADFAEFIAQFEPAAALPYLSDVARLDWAIHCAHYAPDCVPLSAERIVEHAEVFASLKFSFHPAMQLLQSPYPIAAILAMHHGEAAPSELNVAECVLVWRDQYAKISSAEWQLISALQAKYSMADALEQVAERHPEFDPATVLGLLLQHGLIIGVA